MPLEPSPGVVRAGRVLAALADAAVHGRPSLNASELARLVGVPRATCNSILLGLQEAGLVRRNVDLNYALGIGCVPLGEVARRVNPSLQAASVEADLLARELRAVVAVTIRNGAETSVAAVFDHGPQVGNRVRALESMPLMPPFGASFVAWDERLIAHWLDRANPALTEAEGERYRRVLAAARRRGYSVTIASAEQRGLAEALDRLARGDDAANSARDLAMRGLRHDQYLAEAVAEDETVHLVQVSAPVFEPSGEVFVGLMALGPSAPVSGAEVAALGQRLVRAADRAGAAQPGWSPPR